MHYDILYEFEYLQSRSCSEIMSKFVEMVICGVAGALDQIQSYIKHFIS